MTTRKKKPPSHGATLAVLLAHTAVVMVRFAVGKHLDGKNRSGATFHERGTAGEAHWFGRGQASPWARLAGRERAAIRWTIVLITFGMLTARSQTEWALALIGGPVAGVLYWRLRRRWELRDHRTQLVVPLAAALADKMGQDHSIIAHHHLKVRPDYTDAEPGDVIATYRHLPANWAASRKDEAFIEHLFRSRIPVAMDFRWTTHTHPMRFEAVAAASPPTDVALADYATHMAALPMGVYFFGVSASGEICDYDTCGEEPMIASGARTRQGKALALDTPIPVPAGWTTMGDLQTGDIVFDETGRQCRITHAWPVMHDRPCFDVEFSDGSVITADADHLWLAETRSSRISEGAHLAKRKLPPGTSVMSLAQQGKHSQQHKRSRPVVVTTAEMAKSLVTASGHTNYSVRVAGALQCPEADLPIPPYVLGAWLGDGTSATGSITTVDPEVLAEIEHEGETVWLMPSTVRPGYCAPSYRIKGLQAKLRDELNVLGNKHIPVQYLRASEDQRRALLAGLLDTDGYCDIRGRAFFYSTKERLAHDALLLISSLGYKSTVFSKTARLDGRDCGLVWTVSFQPTDKVFRLPRKLARQVVAGSARNSRRYIVAIRPVPSVPVRCITVDSPGELYLAGESCIPTHNTNIHLAFSSQGLRRGEEFYTVDPKRKSMLVLRGVPGFHLANDPGNPEQMVGFITGFAKLLRDAIEEYAADPERSPHRTLILEEMPTLFRIIDQWWDRVRGKDLKRNNPAWLAVRDILNQGAEFHHRVMVCAQDLTDEVLFKSRNSFGTILMNGFKPAQWRNQVGTTPIPACPRKPGRFYLVRYGKPELIHVVCADSRPGHGRHNEQLWREYALAGRQPQTDTWTGEYQSGAWGQHEELPPVPDPEVLALSPVLIGPKQGAAYLGMTYDQFTMARRRHPIKGEIKHLVKGQETSCWAKETLDLWVTEVRQNA